MQHFFAVPTFRGKTPYLVLGVDATGEMGWAMLLYELTPLGLATGVFSTDDISGFRSVIAPASERAKVPGVAVRVLLEQGAQVVMVSCLKGNGKSVLFQSSVRGR